MQYKQQRLRFSPSDIVSYTRSPFITWMNRWALEDESVKALKDSPDAMLNHLAEKGYDHEDAFFTYLKSQYQNVVKIDDKNLTEDEQVEATLCAMKGGADVIFQARLTLGNFAGFADFLVKVNTPSSLGDYSYEPWDTKLAKNTKVYFLLQLCCYAEMLEAIQGVLPKHVTVVLGNNEKESFLTTDYFDYYQCTKASFLEQQQHFAVAQQPDPFLHSDVGDWSGYVDTLRVERDHLSQVATITQNQIKKLNSAGIYTMTGLASSTLTSITGIHSDVLARLIAQADIQVRSKGSAVPLFKVLPHNPADKRGLALLPPSSPLDVFFDIEGYPLDEGGLEYLWGNTYFDEEGQRTFKDFWAHNPEQEKQCFIDFINWVYDRWQRDPTMHIYHYASYEITACRKLMNRYGVCEHEVDALLRNEVFVDLYKVVRGGILLGDVRYSIKNVEHLYRGKRETEVGNGGDSVVVYEHWRTLNAAGKEGDTWQISKILHDIRLYNIDDCDSTQELVDWLREQQLQHSIAYCGKTDVEEIELSEEVTQRTKMRDELLRRAENLKVNYPEQATLNENLAYMLEFYRREDKPVYWRLFDRLGAEPQELLDDLDCLAMCIRTSRAAFAPPRARSAKVYEYRFDIEQEFKGKSKKFFVLGEETPKGKPLTVEFVSNESSLQDGLIAVKSTQELPTEVTLIPDEIISSKIMEQALDEIVASFLKGDLFEQNNAAMAFLSRSLPKIRHIKQGEPIVTSHDATESMQQIIEAVKGLDNSYLPIQGPPGTGKSYTAKHIIAELVKDGKKVGISSNSHKAINHLLISTAQHCLDNNIEASFACTSDTDSELLELGITVTKNSDIAKLVVPSVVVGTTVWGFAREDVANEFDYLFIDEAGQVSIANLIAMSRAARNIVLLGDQMQLGQPKQGTHPKESGLFILDYLLQDTPTIDDARGIFLDTTYRMHSSVNQFISKHIYGGKLRSDVSTDKRFIDVPAGYQGLLDQPHGIFFAPVEHEGNTQASDEEIVEIIKLSNEMLGRTYHTGDEGTVKKITLDDVLYVAPYNHQVTKLKQALGSRAKVGTVDKFQGQEAAIVFVSMCTSDASDSPRGVDFVFDKHRINVAISRAKCMVVVVGNPNLISTKVSTPVQAKKVNLFSAITREG